MSRPRSGSNAARAVGWLQSGESYYAPLGEMRSDGERVQCHLCGRYLRMVGGSHLLAAHGWTTAEYRDAFGLIMTASTAGPATAKCKHDTMLDQIGRGERHYPLPVPAGPPTAPAWRSLAVVRPELAREWHPSHNRKLERAGLDPGTIGIRSTKQAWWRCARCRHEWQASVEQRSSGSGCPVCHAAAVRERSLAYLRPELAREWHPDRNPGLDPQTVTVWSARRVWWRCDRCGHEWRTTVKHRTARGQGCPQCAKRRLAEAQARRQHWRLPPDRSFAVNRPGLLAEWHPERNQGLDPYAIGTGSSLKVWWRCQTCGHQWQARPAHRCQGSGCPICAARRVPRERSLAVLRPDLLDQWHPQLNAHLDPHTIGAKSAAVTIWWQCPHCGHEWQSTPNRRSRSSSRCPACARQHRAGNTHPSATPHR